jgi:ArsR family transcriptional regulator
MRWSRTAAILAQLGNTTRLAVFRIILRAGTAGLTIGDVQRAAGLPPSTLAFHLRGLVAVGLVRRRRSGRTIRCTGNLSLLTETLDRVAGECCRDLPPAEWQKQRQTKQTGGHRRP